MEEIKGVVPNLTRFLFSSIRASAAWAVEAFVSLCEGLVRATVWSVVLVFVAVLLIDGSTWLQSRGMMIAGVVIGFVGFMCFAIASSIFRMGIEVLAGISTTVKREVERLSNIMFIGVLAIFYLSLDRAYQHPILLLGFLATLAILYWATILPSESGLIGFFKPRFQWIVLVWAVLLTIAAVTPSSIINRVIGGHWSEKVTGTVATEVPFRVDEQDQIIDLTTQRPMEIFEQVSSKGEPPKMLKGWVRDKKGNYHIYKWFDGQGNYTVVGQEIKPITTVKIDDIVIQTKRVAKQKLVTDKKIAAEQKAVADAESAKLKAEEERRQEAQRVADEIVRQQAETERLAREATQEQQRQLALQPISVASTILGFNQDKDIVVVRPKMPFPYQRIWVHPERSVVVLNIVEVKQDPTNKNQYLLTLQPSMIISDGQKLDISRQAGFIQLAVKKDNSHSVWKVLGGAVGGAVIGGIAGGKKGALVGAAAGTAAGTIYAMASHGKKFQLTVGNSVPPILIVNPVP